MRNPSFFSATLFLCAAFTAQLATALERSPNDQREYKQLVLANKMQVLLISDPGTRKAAASVSVNTGSRDDPKTRQGLAHFLEHMLFLGTEKYPEPDAYQAFISEHGGSHNAYTAFEETNYFFDVDADSLEPALDRFAQFFIAPLFNKEYVAREIHAVDSEYRARLKDDPRRSLDVFQQVINPSHPFATLSVGNVTTLTGGVSPERAPIAEDKLAGAYDDLRNELLDFYKRFYSANQMNVVVLGQEDIATLEKWVRARFTAVKNYKTDDIEIETPLFAADSLPRIVTIKPEKNTRSLGITFPIPDMSEHFRSKPAAFVGNLIGHEGKGSLLSFLKAKGWAESLSAGQGLSYKGGSTFNISITLTEQGLLYRDAILDALFQTIARIRKEGVQRWMHDEQALIAETAFRFQEQSPPIRYVSHISSNMHRYPAERILSAPYVLDKYKPRLIRKVLDALTPENALITVMAADLEYDSESPWYSTPYKVIKPDAFLLKRWQIAGLSPDITLPARNPFLAESFTQLPKREQQEKPRLIVENARAKLWWGQDQRFASPRSEQYYRFNTALVAESAESAAKTALLVELLNDKLNEFAYPALLAGLDFALGQDSRGMTLRLAGYSDKQSKLLQEIVASLADGEFDQKRFVSLKQELLRRWSNSSKRLPYKQLYGAVGETLSLGRWPEQAMIDAVQSLTLEDITSQQKALLQSAKLEALVFGAMSEKEAGEQLVMVMQLLDADTDNDRPAQAQVLQLPARQVPARQLSIDHSDAAVLQYYQARDTSDKSRALYALTTQALKADFFQELRTEQQLGYIVFSTGLPLHKVPGMAFLVQAPRHSAAHVYDAIQAFLADFAERDDLNPLWFEKQRGALVSDIVERPKNAAEQAQRFWAALSLGDTVFKRRERLLAAVKAVTLEEWLVFYRRGMAAGKGAQLVLWSAGKQGMQLPASHLSLIENAGQFKKTQSVFAAETAKH
jgi:secreted Zn-dependent insulinase-like peptidase